MKTRRKILITILAIVLLYVVIIEVDNFILGNLHQTSIHQSVGNSNECWYQEDDETMTPCKIESHGFGYAVTMGWILFGPYIILGIAVVSFVIWRKKRK